ncbi:FAD-dependent monooxygenase [Pseudonocardia kongjuensis]|uniref:FAD-dependent monooxygenase n=1 Tax=Pseudonocardia kongjuensis TaxID=102227 RepID=A0ABP4IA65_9PSEU
MADGLRVAVVGGGIGGLACANALLGRGVDVHVYEQAPELGEVGAGVFMSPNSRRLLERMGLGPALASVGARVGEGSCYYRADGTRVAPIMTTDSSGWNGVYGMHRADLLEVLATALPAERVHTGHRCVGFEQDADVARLFFADGQRVEAEVVVAADGIKSVLQQYVVPPSTPVDSGSVAYRGLIPAAELPWWKPEVSQLWMGEGKHFMAYPVRRGELINYVGFLPYEKAVEESWSAPGDPDELRAGFTGWAPEVTRLLEKVETTHWWGLYDREPLSRWTEGRLTLLGDAAHPMLPHLGQGANQSIEDGVALAVHLGRAAPADAPQALLAYEEQRRPRTSEVQLGARANGRRYDSQLDDLGERDSQIASSVSFRQWLYDHDAEAAAEAGEPAAAFRA